MLALFLGGKLTLAIPVALLLSLHFASCCHTMTPSGHFVQLPVDEVFYLQSCERRSLHSRGRLLVDDLNKTTFDQCYSSRSEKESHNVSHSAK